MVYLLDQRDRRGLLLRQLGQLARAQSRSTRALRPLGLDLVADLIVPAHAAAWLVLALLRRDDLLLPGHRVTVGIED